MNLRVNELIQTFYLIYKNLAIFAVKLIAVNV